MKDILQLLDQSVSSYHAVSAAAEILDKNGFNRLSEGSKWNLTEGGRYYVVRDGSALVAFVAPNKNTEYAFNIIASHTDSPCLKLKLNAENASAGCSRISTERYGGGLNYSMLDVPLCVAGRVIVKTENGVESKLVRLKESFVIPSVAIHFNRAANDGIKFNPQVDLQAVSGLGDVGGLKSAIEEAAGGEAIDYDLFLTPCQAPFAVGFEGRLACSPRVDNLTSAFASVEAIVAAQSPAIPVIFLADNEEVGSRSKQGAGSTMLKDALERINLCLNKTEEQFKIALSKSYFVSCDNAHAQHPNHPELSDPQNACKLGGGIVIKHHANQNYTTEAMSSAAFKLALDKAGVKWQDFFMRSDLPCGGTLGAISSSQLSIRSIDIGIAQLAMHSFAETFALSDYADMTAGLTAFFNMGLMCSDDGVCLI